MSRKPNHGSRQVEKMSSYGNRYLRKSIQKVADGYEFKMPNPKDMPPTGTGKPSLQQGVSHRYPTYLRDAIDKTLKECVEEIEQEAQQYKNIQEDRFIDLIDH